MRRHVEIGIVDAAGIQVVRANVAVVCSMALPTEPRYRTRPYIDAEPHPNSLSCFVYIYSLGGSLKGGAGSSYSRWDKYTGQFIAAGQSGKSHNRPGLKEASENPIE